MKIWQYNTVPVDGSRQWCIDHLGKPSTVDYELLTEFEGMTNSNAIRYKLLADHPKDVWLDTDVLIKSWWTPPDDGVIYCDYSSGLIFPNGNGKVFLNLFNYYLKSGIQHTILLAYLKDNSIPFNLIPEGKFHHLALNMLSDFFAGIVCNQECMVEKVKGDFKMSWVKGIGIINQ